MSDETDAKPEDMLRIFGQVRPPEFSGDVTRVAPEVRCGGGVTGCETVFMADRFATDKLQKFLTHMAQGVAAYGQMVREAAQTYDAASDNASKALTDQVRAQVTASAAYDPRRNLPDFATGFDRPAT